MDKKMIKNGKNDIEEAGDPSTANAGKIVTNFRHSPDIENFYRFVYENSLRKEARMIFEKILDRINKTKKKKKTKLTH